MRIYTYIHTNIDTYMRIYIHTYASVCLPFRAGSVPLVPPSTLVSCRSCRYAKIRPNTSRYAGMR